MATAGKKSHSDRAGKKESKTVTFFQNGDRYFQGQVVVVTPRRFRSLDMLKSELSRKTNLPQGVRYLLAIDDGTNVQSLEDLQDGKAYVCSSSTKLKKLSYGNRPTLPSWSSRPQFDLPKLGSENRSTKKERLLYNNRFESNTRSYNVESKAAFKPKNVTCIRNGRKPRAVAKILLNKRTTQNLEQVLNQVSDTLAKFGSASNIRKLFTTKGQRVLTVNELFEEANDIFIAVGNEKFKPADIEDIIEDFGGHSKLSNMKVRNPRMHKENKQRDHLTRRASQENGDKRRTISGKQSEEEENVNHLPKMQNKTLKPHENKPLQVKPSHRVGKQSNRGTKDKNENKPLKQSNHYEKFSSGSVKLPQIENAADLVARKPDRTSKGKGDSKSEKKENRNVVAAQHESNTTARDNDEDRHDSDKRKQKKNSLNKIRQGKISKDNTAASMESRSEYGTITDKRAEDVYDIGQKLGDGNFAVVRECFHKITKKRYALKIIDRKKIKGKEAMLQDEINIMRRCRHPNIVRLYEDYDTATEIYLTMEMVEGGDLFDAISSNVKFTEQVASSYLRDVANALYYLHKQHIVHRDLKPENLLLHRRTNGHINLKLADFGLAMEVKAPIFTVCGTPTYVAPEILEETGYGLKVDMWAAGVITYIMLCGFPPFRSAKRDQDELFDLIQEGEFEFLSPYWDPVSDSAKDLVTNLLVVGVSQRYSAEQVLKHPWVRKKSATVSEISEVLLAESERPTLQRRRRFKAAGLAVQGAKRMENLAEQFHHQRGEKVIIT